MGIRESQCKHFWAFALASMILLAYLPGALCASPPGEVWNSTFGVLDKSEGYAVEQADDGGYVVVGTAQKSDGDSDIAIVKAGSDGTAAWNKTLDIDQFDRGYSADRTGDGGYVVAGATRSDGPWNPILAKVDGEGNLVWNKAFGNQGYIGRSVQETDDGGYILTGYAAEGDAPAQGDVLLIRADADGNQVWSKSFNSSEVDGGNSVAKTSDGGYIIAGFKSNASGDQDAWLIKADANGRYSGTRHLALQAKTS